MKELVFALQFKGKARPVEGVEGKLAAKTTAAGQVLHIALTAKGVQAKAESSVPALRRRPAPGPSVCTPTSGCNSRAQGDRPANWLTRDGSLADPPDYADCLSKARSPEQFVANRVP